MMNEMSRSLTIRFVLLSLLAGWILAAPSFAAEEGTAGENDDFVDIFRTDELDDEEDESNPPSTSARSRKAERAEALIKQYLSIYDEHFQSDDRVTRAMAVIALGRIDDPRVAERLLEVLEKDRDRYVRAFAWEVLHARNPSLTPDQRQRWVEAGQKMVLNKHCIRGRLREGLLRATRPLGPTSANRQIFRDFFEDANLMHEGDRGTLQELRASLAAWRDPQLVKDLIRLMDNPDAAYRAEFVLAGLDTGLETAQQLHNMNKPLDACWAWLQKKYARWYKEVAWEPFDAEAAEPYTGRSELIDPPGVLDDPDDPKWRKDLELPRLSMGALYLAIVMDSTGSMGAALEWLKHDVARLMHALRLISREPAIGITFYRDVGEDYIVRMYEMTDREKKLARAISRAEAEGGGDYPEAVYAALRATVEKHRWPDGEDDQKVVLLFGDAPPHRENVDELRRLVEKSVENGFRFHCFTLVNSDFHTASQAARADGRKTPLNPQSAFADIAKWGKGTSGVAMFDRYQTYTMVPGRPIPRYVNVHGPQAEGSYRRIVTMILEGMVNEEYRDRAAPFATLLLECLETSPPERRSYSPVPPPPTHGPRQPQRPRKPEYRQ